MFPRIKESFQLLMIGIVAYILYLKSHRGSNQLEQTGFAPTYGNEKFFIDNDGNQVPVFSDETLFPKPGGGYCKFTSIKDQEEYFQAIVTPEVKCDSLEDFKGYKACMDGFKKNNNCVALSFGICWHFHFEDSIIDKLGCQAYSFDPTMNTPDHDRKNGKDKFFNLGLSSFKGSKTIRYEGRSGLSKVDRYVNIVNMLGLANTEIDFLKVDIEGSEYDFFLDTASNNPELLKNVKQIQLEFHNLEKDPRYHSGNKKDTTQLDMMKIVDILRCHGFALAYSEMNKSNRNHVFMYKGKQRALCYVTTWIRP